MENQLIEKSTPAPKSRQGKGSKQKQRDAFNMKKNREFDQKIADDLATKYGLNDFPSVQQIPTKVSKPTTFVPVTLRTSTVLIDKIWAKMQSLGIRNFSQYDTPAYKLNFLKVILLLGEAKVAFGQRNGSPKLTPAHATSILTFNEDQLLRLMRLAKTLPKPIAAYLDQLGSFQDLGQTVVPVKARLTACPEGSGAFNYFPSDLKPLLQALRDVGAVMALQDLRHYLEPLGASFEDVDGRMRLTEASYNALQFPDEWITGQMEEMFHVLVRCFNLRRKFNSVCNIETGVGQKTQIVRFPEYDEGVNRYYANGEVSSYHQNLAAAFGYGQEQEGLQKSRFVTSLEQCLMAGEINVDVIRHEVVWYEDPE